LLKSADDLRQDAVMEQVFSLVNDLLSNDAATRLRRLRVRTYNVVPLTAFIGLVEWVLGTTSLYDTLCHPSRGVHARYRPLSQTKSFGEHYQVMRDAHGRDKKELPRVFANVCKDFPPMFHRYFIEQFADHGAAAWMARRTAYTRSVAVNSIVGYVVGLGISWSHYFTIFYHNISCIFNSNISSF
jgi:ataxia telangiectasia mutated family protein